MRLRKNEQHNLKTFFQEMLVHIIATKEQKKTSMEPPYICTTATLCRGPDAQIARTSF